MRIFVKVKPNAKVEKVEKIDEVHFVVSVKAPPVEGKANEALIKLLSDYFNIPKGNIKIVSGLSSKSKIVEILKT
ncbi:hypothetical protein JGI7_02012 [Candidatus Kryptonium thompsonii]|uniref:UPF0235 protein JGI4_00381 n=1 Tax=Candidatus Kryptonium thompsonii TaxID=1633631 RepID=A0A0P1LJC9_9BACT|nr:DUF167 domain-containing protein [Candidatus Kryptonium thompsoni]CUS78157.1 hypothetical protein JGI15_100320 [Candidatus Kryptonium thompsoni]CUS81362.1 hypothetical protein JGI16_10369 [Candidatus Kryptonium thompsoni]CUS81686.1 hypothetical protein JGI14_10112 [Candidatus Kryptonium thompsoni]CUS84813.1 hypothetical protein JGI13_01110 [Candidatus Kryptonium thompsoni]CUS85871.1 hypothetical protein JGI6_01084 [Candidatus Kryptonium thompsoni]